MASVMFAVVLVIVASLAPGGSTQSATFFVTAPNVFRVGVPEKVLVTVIRPSQGADIPVRVTMMQPSSAYVTPPPFFNQTIHVTPGSTGEVIVTVQAENMLRNEGSNQHMVLKAESQDAAHPFSDETEVLVTLESGYVFVQTDKPIYTPNQEVKIKVMSLEQNMLPSNREVHIEVINPNNIRVKRLIHNTTANGFISGSYSFHHHPPVGIWTVTASYGPRLPGDKDFQVKSNVTFELKEYVLPTFSVEIETPQYILDGAESVVIGINAQYVFGKPVIGRYALKYGVLRNNGSVDELGEVSNSLDSNGAAEVTLRNLDVTFQGPGWFGRFKDCRFHLKATVLEAATLFSEASVNTKAMFVRSPYKFSSKRTVRYFKTGLNFHVKLDLTYANGDVATAVPVQLSTTLPGNQVYPVSNTDEMGSFSETVPNIASGVVRFGIQAITVDPAYPNNQERMYVEVSAAESSNNMDYLIISTARDRNLVVNENTVFSINKVGNGVHDDMHFVCITAGKIVQQGTLDAGETSLTLVIQSDMAPQMRLIVYYVNQDGSVIADSVVVGVKEGCQQNPELELTVDPEIIPPALEVYPPNSLIDVEVTAPDDAFVGLLAVDKAVYLLRDKDRMTSRKMYERMLSYDTGCGPGGGQNTAQIFKDSGMTVITNANLDVGVRDELRCVDEVSRKRRSAGIDTCISDDVASCIESKPRLANRWANKAGTCTFWARLLAQQCDLANRAEFVSCCTDQISQADTFSSTGRSAGSAGNVNQAVVRQDFRETWFFDIVQMPGDGSPYRHQATTPSSITEWKLTAVSLSATQGMCVKDSTSLTVFQNFFIQLHLPYSVVRLEQTEIKATVFNYGLDDLQEVTVVFNVGEGLCTASNPATRYIHVGSKNAASAAIIVRPVEIGEFDITVTASAGHISDAVRKRLRVVPQGILTRKGRSITLNPGNVMFNDESEDVTLSPNLTLAAASTHREPGRQSEQIAISLPAEFIPETESCSVKLIGSLMGSAATDPIDGVENLVSQPTGCGEQTMIRLAPTLFVYKYLQAIREVTADLEQRVIDYITNGISRELTYLQGDGSYAAFLRRPGSTWLTAFVVKIFSQAYQVKTDFVDANDVKKSTDWLIDRNQQESGAFLENHHVIHQEMIGAVKGDISRTAFVLIALLESRNAFGDADEKLNGAIVEATEFLVNNIDQLERIYDKAIVTYALALAQSARVQDANDILKASQQVDQSNQAVYFSHDARNYDANVPFWLTRKPKAIWVETTAYALLAQMELGDYQYAGRIALWLSSNRNYDGGFVSTQDTVIALQALAKYAERPEFSDIDMTCAISVDQQPLANYRILNDNAKIQEEVDVRDSIGRSLLIDSVGVGVAEANVELRYYTASSDIDTCPFHLNISAVEIPSGSVNGQNVRGLTLTVCARHTGEGTPAMSIIDVGLYSGFKAVEFSEPGIQGLKDIVNGSDLVASYEASSRSVIFYLDTVPNDEDLCITFTAKSDVVVGNVQAAAVHINDYYDPDESCTIFYKPEASSALLQTLCSENDCVCTGGSLGYCNADGCDERSTREELEIAACSSHRAYALKIRINSEETKDGFRIYDFTVTNPIKPGEDGVTAGGNRLLYVDEGCECPKVKSRTLGGEFLLVGDKVLKYTSVQGVEGYRYVWGQSSKLEFWPAVRRPNRNHIEFDKLVTFESDFADSPCANEELVP